MSKAELTIKSFFEQFLKKVPKIAIKFYLLNLNTISICVHKSLFVNWIFICNFFTLFTKKWGRGRHSLPGFPSSMGHIFSITYTVRIYLAQRLF